MKISEFKSMSKYLADIEEERKPKDKREQLMNGTVRNAEFFSLIPLILEKHQEARVRDMLEVDATFAIVFPKSDTPKFIESISLYQDVQDICSHTLYTRVKNTGLIDMDGFVGFWVLLGV